MTNVDSVYDDSAFLTTSPLIFRRQMVEGLTYAVNMMRNFVELRMVDYLTNFLEVF